MVPIFFPAGCMFLLSMVPIFVEGSDSNKRLYFSGLLIVVAGLAAFLNHETTWRVKVLSAFMIVAAWFFAGFLESHQTGFIPPINLVAASAGILFFIALLSVFAGSAFFHFLIVRSRKQISDE